MCRVDEALGPRTGAKIMGLGHLPLPFDAQAPKVGNLGAGIYRLWTVYCLHLQVTCFSDGCNMEFNGRMLKERSLIAHDAFSENLASFVYFLTSRIPFRLSCH
jgi:hypothetical protein